MRFRFLLSLAGLGLLFPNISWGHGFDLSVNSYANPSAFLIGSAQPVLDNDSVSPTPGPSNLFLDQFDSSPNADGSYPTDEGFAQTSGPFPAYTSVTFNIISPLYFSDGTGPAVFASAGTQLHIFDLWAGNPAPLTDPHPGASLGDLYVDGAAAFYPGFGVSLYDAHELEKDVYLAANSTQTYGEYGFAFDVTVHFAGGQTVNSGPLVDVFALDITTDPANPGGFATFAPFAQQDLATQALYNAAVGVPEPSSGILLGAAGIAAVATAGFRSRCRTYDRDQP